VRRALPVLLALALASCTSGTTVPGAHRSATPGAAPSSATPVARVATAPARRSLVVAVQRSGHEGLWLYRVDAARRAHLVRQVAPPGGGGSDADAALSAGATPTLCVVWSDDSVRTDPAWCYPWGRDGSALPVDGEAYGLALREDGEAVAWESVVNPGSESDSWDDLVVASTGSERTRYRRHFVSQEAGSPPAGTRPLGCSDTAGRIVWAGADELLLQAWGDNDFPGQLYLHSVADGPTGSAPACREVRERHEPSYNYFTDVGWSDGRTFLAVEGEYCELQCPGGREPLPQRAVRVDVRTGRVTEAVATPAPGRSVTGLSGGPDGIVYRTYGGGEERCYLRWPGEKHGAPVTGLPSDVEQVVAQP
jgi:hypothetical protein